MPRVSVHELALEADEPARRDAVLEAHAALAVGRHVLQLAAAAAQLLHDVALVARSSTSTVSALARLVQHAVDFLGRARAACRHGELVTFAAHVLDEDGEVQFAAARDAEHVGVAGFFDAQRDVAIELALRRSRIWRLVTYLPSLPASGEVFTWKFMVSVGSSTPTHRQRLGLVDVADRVADVEVLDAGDGDDVAGHGFGSTDSRAGP